MQNLAREFMGRPGQGMNVNAIPLERLKGWLHGPR